MSIDAVLKKFRQVVDYASTPIPRDYYQFSAPSLNWIVSGGQGVKGIQSGVMIELVGKKSSGKSTLALDLIAQAQRQDKLCVYADFERSLDPSYAAKLGVDISQLVRIRPESAEQGLEVIEEVIKAGAGIVVVDSLAMMVPRAEWDKSYDDSQKVAANAGLITRFVNRVNMLADSHNTLVVLINQVRANLNPMARAETKHYGGFALEHAVRMIIEVSRIANKETFTTVQAVTSKNKLGGAERLKAEFQIEYGKGIRADLDIIDCAIAADIIQQRGPWLNFGELKAQGKENAILTFPLNQIRKELEQYYDRV